MILGVTGGVASGKSTVADMLARRGAVVFSADEASRRTTAPGSAALQQIVERFGEQVLAPDGKLNRAALADIVFSDLAKRRDLEAITHPPILNMLRRQVDEAVSSNPHGTLIAVEVPLLYESNMESWFDRVLLVAAAEETQVRRLQSAGCSREQAVQRIGAQMSLAEKRRRADDVIDNDGSVDSLRRRVEYLLRKWRREGLTPIRVQSSRE